MLLLDISNGLKTTIMMVLMAIVFYFFLIRPQSQQRKKETAYRNSLKAGDHVMTVGGIHGVVASTDEFSVRLEIAPGKIIRVAKTGIQTVTDKK